MRAEQTLHIHARPSKVWEHVADPSRYTEWMRDITHFDRIGDGDTLTCGTRFSMRMKVGSAEVGGVIEIVELDECRDIAWHSVSGIDQRGRLRLREVEPGTTRVTFRVSYQSPGGVWGLIADRVSGPQVRRNLAESLQALRDRCEEQSGAAERRPDLLNFARNQLTALRVIADTGLLRPSRPDRFLAALVALYRWGLTLPGGFTAAAARWPETVAVIDERTSITYAEIDRRTNAIASELAAAGIREGDRVGVLCRNHAGFLEAMVATSKVGADVLLLNTGFARPQLRAVLGEERVTAIIHDAEFANLIGNAVPTRRRFIAWSDAQRSSPRSLERLAARGSIAEPSPPEKPSHITILTSGTTGAPKGASQSQPRSADPIIGILSRIPLRARETTLIAAPLFHAWGLAHLGLGVALSSTIVLHRQFDPERTLAGIEEHGASALIAIPIMLRRILELPKQTRERYDTSSLRVVAVSGSALPSELANQFMDEYGDILYNLYGSTEVAAATIANPQDLRAAPGTAGRAPFGTVIRLLDDQGREVPAGQVGRIFVKNDMLFEGYTQGSNGKETVDGLLATGDMGRLDEEGRLFIEGRSDDMVVSGGENVYPAEVEELLLQHPNIKDVAVVGVADEEWGGRLRAYVVTQKRSRLTEQAVKQHVKARLARHKVPRDVVFVDEIPRSSTGKVAKAQLQSGGE